MKLKERRFWRRKSRRPAAPPRLRAPAASGSLPALGTAAGYALGGALATAAFAAETLLLPVFQFSTFLMFYPGAFVTALLAGTGPALFNLALAGAGTMWLLIQRRPAGESPLLAGLHTAAFLVFSGAAAALAGRLRRAERALRESEKRLRIFKAATDNSSDFIGIADADGSLLYVNPAGRAMVGLAPEQDVSSTAISDYYPEDTRDFARDAILASMLERGSWKGVTAFRNFRTNSRIPVWDEHFLIRDPGGRTIGMGTVTRDATERLRIEEDLKSSREELRRAQEMARIGSWRLDVPRDELVWSEETFKLFGLPAGSPMAYEDFLELVHPEDRKTVDDAWKAAQRGAPYELEHRILVGGQTRWIRERAELELDASGKVVRGIGTAQDVTERRKAEEDLVRLREQERFRTALEAAANAMVVATLEGLIVWVNGEAERLFGWTREELAGRSVELLMPEGLRANVMSRRRRFIQEGAYKRVLSADRDLFALRKDGAKLPVEVILTRVREGDRDFEVASITDITLRKRAEDERSRMFEEVRRAKEQAEADLAAMTRLQSISLMSLQRAGLEAVLAEILDAAIAISGADFGNIQVLDPKSWDLVIAAHRGFPQWWLDFWNRVSRGHGTCGTALERGERVIVEDIEKSPAFVGTPALDIQRRAGIRAVQSTPLVSRAGKPLGMFSTHYKTPRRPSKRALRMLDLLARQAADILDQAKTAEALRDSEQSFRLLVQGTRGYAIFMYDSEGRVTVWNEGAQRLYGYTAEEALGSNFDRFYTPEDKAAGVPEADLRAAVEKGSCSIEGWRLRKDGSRFWASTVTTAIYDAAGRHLGYGKVVRDLTERRAAEKALEDTAERLRATVLDLESFAYTISHDLRSPLRAIQGYAHFLYERLAASADSDSRRMLTRMEQAALRLDVLIKDLLAFNAVARQKVTLQPVDLDETLAHLTDHYPELSRAKLRVRAPLGKALAQPSLLIQVLANLLVNAVKFVPPDRRPEIEVYVERRGGKALVSVRDNGIGIARESLPRLFKPFERLHRADAYPGTGMGLAVVKRAVERMGGTIAVESEPGKGSVFTVTLGGDSR